MADEFVRPEYVEYQVHDTQKIDEEHPGPYGIIKDPERFYFMDQAPAMIRNESTGETLRPQDWYRDSVTGFTNTSLHRRLDPKMPDENGDDKETLEKLKKEWEDALKALQSYKESKEGSDCCCGIDCLLCDECCCDCCDDNDDSKTHSELIQEEIAARAAYEEFLATTTSFELLPRKYFLSIKGVHSYREIEKFLHVDYQDIDKYIEENPEYEDLIRERYDESELREIP